jgi:hypothetical protein
VDGGLDSRIMVSDTRRDAGCATYVTLVLRGGRVNSTSSSHLGRAAIVSGRIRVDRRRLAER